MPIFVCDYHLLNNFLDVLVCRFYRTIHLRTIRRGSVMLDFEFTTHLSHHFIVEIGGIVCDDFAGQSISTYQFLFDESEHYFPGHIGI
ncbi:hypothetical protein Lalb_Chr22g0353081 [Lupinus albus]|uniref:Uncharacterized protein n=1 Tax=Lupinus albus TaxID=3870 RepID=A0A6A4NFJ6_LUPAL|nr:hypothetical protein Lalb_Chr22g0353081 [Lupinus albus]